MYMLTRPCGSMLGAGAAAFKPASGQMFFFCFLFIINLDANCIVHVYTFCMYKILCTTYMLILLEHEHEQLPSLMFLNKHNLRDSDSFVPCGGCQFDIYHMPCRALVSRYIYRVRRFVLS
jgi:hypothetical protein